MIAVLAWAGCGDGKDASGDTARYEGVTGIAACVIDYDHPLSPANVFVRESAGDPEIQFTVDAAGCVTIERDAGTRWDVQARTTDEGCFSAWLPVDVPDGPPAEITLDVSYLCVGR